MFKEVLAMKALRVRYTGGLATDKIQLTKSGNL